MQNKVLRLRNSLHRDTPKETLLATSGDLSVQQLTELSTLNSFQNVLSNGKPKYLADRLKNNNITTRQENNIIIASNLTLTRGAYFYRGARLFSQLPLLMRGRMDPAVFMTEAKHGLEEIRVTRFRQGCLTGSWTTS